MSHTFIRGLRGRFVRLLCARVFPVLLACAAMPALAAGFATTTVGVPAGAIDTQPVTVAAAILIDPADVASLLPGEPGGTIDFFDNGVYAGTYPVTDVVPAQCGTTQCYVAEAHARFFRLPVGTHPFTAVYSGHGRFASSTSAPFDIAIAPISHRGATTLVGLPATAIDTQPVTVAVALLIDPADAATLLPGEPGGTIQFFDNGVPAGAMGVTDVVPAQCDATQCYAAEAHFRVSGFSVGTHTFTATYSGDAFFLPSTSAPFDITVTPITTRAPTSTIGVPATVIDTQLVTIAAAIVIDPADAAGLLPGEPRGTVQFLLNGAPWAGNGVTDVVPAQCGPLHCYVAEAHLNAWLPVGTNTFTAVYSGPIPCSCRAPPRRSM
jgi:hypothetical protein